MKKLTLILVTLVYTLSTLGMDVSRFYCCGKLKSETFSFFGENHKTCNKGSDDSGCCQTTHHYLKVNDTHIASQVVFSPEKFFSILHTDFPSVDLTAPKIPLSFLANNINAPPLLQGTLIYIFICIYRI